MYKLKKKEMLIEEKRVKAKEQHDAAARSESPTKAYYLVVAGSAALGSDQVSTPLQAVQAISFSVGIPGQRATSTVTPTARLCEGPLRSSLDDLILLLWGHMVASLTVCLWSHILKYPGTLLVR
jgi:hypothetical protein